MAIDVRLLSLRYYRDQNAAPLSHIQYVGYQPVQLDRQIACLRLTGWSEIGSGASNSLGWPVNTRSRARVRAWLIRHIACASISFLSKVGVKV
jgi:hypothetical protein